MVVKPNKIDRLMEGYQQLLDPDDLFSFLLAICYIKKNSYFEAQRLFDVSLKKMFTLPRFLNDTGLLNWLIDTCILAGGEQYFPDVLQEFELYKKAPTPGITVTAFYGYALMEFLVPTGWDISVSIEELLKRPKWKLWYSIGHVIQSIVNGNSDDFNNTLFDLLNAHERMATMGSLRETSEGLICMQGMSLAYAARKRNMRISIENEYLPISYLDFLMERNANHLLSVSS